MLPIAFVVAALWNVGVSSQPVTDELVKITSLRIRSDIAYRFATTLVSSAVKNLDEVSKEAIFDVRLPKTAFISNFTMEIDGKLYPGVVKEKEAAKKQYERAKKKGQSAGQVVKAKPRETQRFRVVVNVAALSEVHFNLTYQELLQRKFGSYEHVIYIDPGQPVADMRVDIFIVESREITKLRVPPLRNDIITELSGNDKLKEGVSNNLAVIDRLSSKSAHIAFYPTVAQQVDLQSSSGISGQFIVSYDVARQGDAGEILAVNGYFVHFFAPQGLEPMSKRVLFILDTSSSMTGDKIAQLKQAMLAILDDLREGDEFNIERFSTGTKIWKEGKMVPVNNRTITEAKKFIRSLRADGWTNINSALHHAFKVLLEGVTSESNAVSIIVFLTDGHPTKGITSASSILQNVKRANEGGISLSSLAFGQNTDYTMLQQLSAQNFGVARKIYEDSDAALQLQGFYEEISSPVLANLSIKYLGNAVKNGSVTTRAFPTFYDGAEVVVAGELVLSNVPTLDLSITADNAEGNIVVQHAVELEPSPAQPKDIIAFTEKLWAYLTIRQLLDKTLAETDSTKLGNLRAKALHMSVKYGFVTPLTSMVVTKPENEELADDSETDSASGQRNPPRQSHSSSRSRGRGGGGGGGGGGGSSGDSDPHFIVRAKGIEKALCFDVKGKDGDIYQLVADRKTGVFINGKVFGTLVKVGNEEKFRTYFGHIVAHRKPHQLVVTPRKIRLAKKAFKWTENAQYDQGGIKLTVFARDNVTVDIAPGIRLSIVKHRFKKKQIRFLGVYIEKSTGFSSAVEGIMGEFERKNVTVESTYNIDGVPRAKLAVYRKQGVTRLDVGLGDRMNLAEDYKVPCWRVKRSGKGLLDFRAPDEYLVKNLRSRRVLRLSGQTKMKS